MGLLVLVVDVAFLSAPVTIAENNSSTISMPLACFLESLLVFVNAHLLMGRENRIAIVASYSGGR
jgi:hypothetical protein